MIFTVKTSLLGRLQAQTLPDETPSINKIHLISNITVKLGNLDFLPGLECPKSVQYSQFLLEEVYHFGLAAQ